MYWAVYIKIHLVITEQRFLGLFDCGLGVIVSGRRLMLVSFWMWLGVKTMLESRWVVSNEISAICSLCSAVYPGLNLRSSSSCSKAWSLIFLAINFSERMVWTLLIKIFRDDFNSSSELVEDSDLDLSLIEEGVMEDHFCDSFWFVEVDWLWPLLNSGIC